MEEARAGITLILPPSLQVLKEKLPGKAWTLPQRPCSVVTAHWHHGGDPGSPAKEARKLFIFFFIVSAILGDTCLELEGVHCTFFLFCCCLNLISGVDVNSGHPAAGNLRQSLNSLEGFLHKD